MIYLAELLMHCLLQLLFIMQGAVADHRLPSEAISLCLYVLLGTLVTLFLLLLVLLYNFLLLFSFIQGKTGLLFFLPFFKHNY